MVEHCTVEGLQACCLALCTQRWPRPCCPRSVLCGALCPAPSPGHRQPPQMPLLPVSRHPCVRCVKDSGKNSSMIHSAAVDDRHMIDAGMHRAARDEVRRVPAAPVCSCELLQGGLWICAACLHSKLGTTACSMLSDQIRSDQITSLPATLG